MEKFLKQFTDYLQAKGLRSYHEFIPHLREFFFFLKRRRITPKAVSLPQAEAYRSHLLNRQLCHSTINNKINKIKAFYSFLEKRDIIADNPLRELKGLKQGKSLPKNILSTEEMGTLLNSLPSDSEKDLMFSAFAELLYGSAIRISEAVGLKRKDINYSRGFITISEDKKGGIRRTVPATEVSLRIIKKYLKISQREKEEYVFPQSRKTTIRVFVNRRLKKLCDKYGLKVLTSHSFRHSAATSMLRNGAGIREVQSFLGHESILTTEKYTRIIKEDLKRVVKQNHPREAFRCS